METFTTANSCSTGSVTIASLKETMKKVRAMMPPPRETVTGYRINREMIEALKSRCVTMQPTTLSAAMLYGIPIHEDETLPLNVFVSERADGSEVVHVDGTEHRRLNQRIERHSLREQSN